MFKNQKYASPQEIADFLEVSSQTVITYINTGILEAYKFGGRYKITKEQFERFLESSKSNISTD